MDYEKLAGVLIRVLSVWILVQSLPQVVASVYFTAVQLSVVGPAARGMMWNAPIVGIVSLALSVCLFLGSDRLAKFIAPDPAV